MMAKIWIPLYVNDFLSSTKIALMTTEEIGAYVLLLCHAWQDSQCSLPDDDNLLRKLGRISGDLSNIRSCFTVKRGRLVNERLLLEWIKAKEFKNICSNSGKNGADRRWPQRVTGTCSIPVTPPVTGLQHSSPSPSPLDKEEDKRARTVKKLVRAAVTDEVWIQGLKDNPLYTGIDVDLQLRKCLGWFEPKGITVSRQRFYKWLVRAMDDKPVKVKKELKVAL